jgi:hypothetical protein
VVVLLMVTLPPVPGDAMSLGPQPLRASAPVPANAKVMMVFTM